MTDSETSNSLAVVPAGTATIYARVPAYVKQELDEWAETHSMSLSAAVRHLLEYALGSEWPDTRETTREARYRMALEAIVLTSPDFDSAHSLARKALNVG